MEVEGVSLTTSSRTRDSGFEVCNSRSDLVNRQNNSHFITSRGSPPKYSDTTTQRNDWIYNGNTQEYAC